VTILRGKVNVAEHQQTFANIDRIQNEIAELRTRAVSHTSGETDERLGHPSQEAGAKIAQKLRELATELEKLPDPDGEAGESLVVPPTQVVTRTVRPTTRAEASLTADSIDGEVVEVQPLSIRPGPGLAGSAASAYSPLYRAVNQREGTYVAGHLLSAHVFGPGNQFWNLAPITRSANGLMSSGVENRIHDLVFIENKVVHYKITASGSPRTPGPVIPAEGFLPRQLAFEVHTMKLNPSVESAAAGTPGGLDATRMQPQNWQDDASISIAPVPSLPPLNAPLGELTKTVVLRAVTAGAEATPDGRRVQPIVELVGQLKMGRSTIIAALRELVQDGVLRQADNGRYYFRA
jgi:hypothetical protein